MRNNNIYVKIISLAISLFGLISILPVLGSVASLLVNVIFRDEAIAFFVGCAMIAAGISVFILLSNKTEEVFFEEEDDKYEEPSEASFENESVKAFVEKESQEMRNAAKDAPKKCEEKSYDISFHNRGMMTPQESLEFLGEA